MATKNKSDNAQLAKTNDWVVGVKWNPWVGVLLAFAIYVISQIVAIVVLIYPVLHHWSSSQSSNWLTNSIYAQFFYIIIVEVFTILAVLQLLKWFKVDKKVIGLRKPKLNDPLYALIAIPIYYFLYIIVVIIFSSFFKGLNVSETQNVGFNHVHGATELIVTFISLVVLPPIAEEILVRGFLYASLKKGMNQVMDKMVNISFVKKLHTKAASHGGLKRRIAQIAAALLTSAIFASAHLPEGTGGLLWIAFIDTFILSMVLVYLRERTGGLWSGMIVHGVKNGVAYYVLYLSPLLGFHLNTGV